MYTVKVLKRKDAASVVLAILLALVIINPLQTISSLWASKLVIETDDFNRYAYPGQDDWKQAYVLPLLTLVIQVVVIELGLRLAIYIRNGLVRRTK